MKKFLSELPQENGAGAFEYLLATGLLVVPLILVLIAGVEIIIPEIAQFVCPAVDTADPAAAPGSCIPGF